MIAFTTRTAASVLVLAAWPTGVWASGEVDGTTSPEAEAAVPTGRTDSAPADRSPHSWGLKASYLGVHSSGQDYKSLLGVGVDARLELGQRWGFVELGAGLLLPFFPPLDGDAPREDQLNYRGIEADVGVSIYLLRGAVAPYLGLGLLPRAIFFTGLYSETNHGLRFAGYGQAGVTFEGTSRFRAHVDLRVASFLSCFPKMHREGGPTTETNEWVPSGGDVCPLEVGLQAGVSW